MPYQYIIHNRIKQSKSFLKIIIKLVPIFFKIFCSCSQNTFLPFHYYTETDRDSKQFEFLPRNYYRAFFYRGLLFSDYQSPLYLYRRNTIFSGGSCKNNILLQQPVHVSLLFRHLHLFYFFHAATALIR